nr:MAG TPA: hypothetical protein [Caudoviricetes sp.]
MIYKQFLLPSAPLFNVSQRFITFQNTIKSTFLIHNISQHFQSHGTNTEQTKRAITSPLF